ncbi:MAG: hypothetical protein C5S38_01180 [Candidatus Methanophagaceae archaeon]|nr:MAG: hypothetical protein C5S38_01180 [Methanophagales archaeon]KAF5436201.1 methyl-accepting chemotaxis protein [Methanophagales archaeon]
MGLLTSDDIKVFTALAEGVKEDPKAAVKEVAAKLPRDIEGHPYSMDILMVDGLAGVGEEVTLWASYLFGREQRIIGGMAGDDFKMKQTFVYSDDTVCTNALSVCHLTAKIPLFTGVKHGHRPLSRVLTATKTKGNVRYEIDNRPAWEIWKEETAEVARKRAIEVEELETPAEIAQFFTNYTLGLATGKEGEHKIRWPSGINEDGSLIFTCAIAEGAVFRIIDGSNLENQIKAAEEAVVIAKRNAEKAGYSDFAGVIVFDCAVRQLMLGDRFSEAVDLCKNVLPGVPLLGWETYGEIRLEPGQFSGFHNTTSVILLIPNGDKNNGR